MVEIPLQTVEGYLDRITHLEAQVQFAVDYMNDNGWLEEGCFTFPDGETVWATKTGENDVEQGS